MNNYKKGKFAEKLAVLYFRLKGFKIIRRNFVTGKKTGAGEIDLIVKKKNIIVFVEVKQRGSLENAAYAILPHQQQRIWRAAENFLAQNPQFLQCDVRFDAFLLNSIWNFRHIEDAWRL
ncbi:MAG: YraN family protein [Alphaproteobacteria bacterium]|nr:YraN family protein [Alphaproteobacteria bacterium]